MGVDFCKRLTCKQLFFLVCFKCIENIYSNFQVPNEAETLEVLSSGLVDRIGHGTFIHPASGGSTALHTIVRDEKIPLGNNLCFFC